MTKIIDLDLTFVFHLKGLAGTGVQDRKTVVAMTSQMTIKVNLSRSKMQEVRSESFCRKP